MYVTLDPTMPKLPPLHRGRWATFYGDWANGVTTVAKELAIFLASQYRVALVTIEPRRGTLFSRSPRNSWASWARRGAAIPRRDRFLLLLPAPTRRFGKPQNLVRRAFPRSRNLLDDALRNNRLDFVIVDGGHYVAFETGIFYLLPKKHILVSCRADKTCDVRTHWQEGQPPGRLATIPHMPTLAWECRELGIPMVYTSHLVKRVYWEMAVNIFGKV